MKTEQKVACWQTDLLECLVEVSEESRLLFSPVPSLPLEGICFAGFGLACWGGAGKISIDLGFLSDDEFATYLLRRLVLIDTKKKPIDSIDTLNVV